MINNIKQGTMKNLDLNNIKKYDNNETYNSMVAYVKEALSDSPYFKIETFELITTVTSGKNFKAYSSEVCSISLPDGSHINFKSFEDKVDISRIISNHKGAGRTLMLIVIGAYVNATKFTKVGALILECIGSVGVGKNQRDMPVSEQTAFFRKFGFRKFGKYNPEHIHMALQSNDDFNKALEVLTK